MIGVTSSRLEEWQGQLKIVLSASLGVGNGSISGLNLQELDRGGVFVLDRDDVRVAAKGKVSVSGFDISGRGRGGDTKDVVEGFWVGRCEGFWGGRGVRGGTSDEEGAGFCVEERRRLGGQKACGCNKGGCATRGTRRRVDCHSHLVKKRRRNQKYCRYSGLRMKGSYIVFA